MTSELKQAAENLRLQIRGRIAELEAQQGQLQAQIAALGDGPARPALSPLARQHLAQHWRQGRRKYRCPDRFPGVR